MPKPVLFAPCEIVLLDQQNNLSLIKVLESVKINLPVTEIPVGVAIPIRWSILTMWLRQPGDENKGFQQVCELVASDGTVLLSNTAPINLENLTHRHIINNFGFPVPRSADPMYFLKLYVREDIEGAEAVEVSAFPLFIHVGVSPKSDE